VDSVEQEASKSEEQDTQYEIGIKMQWYVLRVAANKEMQVKETLTQKINQEHRRGTSDANFFGAACVPTLDGLGPICDKDHTPEEFIKISSLKERSALLALFLVEYGLKVGMIS